MCLPCFPFTWVEHEDPLDKPMPEQAVWLHNGNAWALQQIVSTYCTSFPAADDLGCFCFVFVFVFLFFCLPSEVPLMPASVANWCPALFPAGPALLFIRHLVYLALRYARLRQCSSLWTCPESFIRSFYTASQITLTSPPHCGHLAPR